MHPRRFPSLTVARILGLDDWSGMIPFRAFDLAAVCDDDLVPGAKASALLRDAAEDFLTQAIAVAETALDFDGVLRDGPFLSAMPRLPGADYEMVVGWRAGHGISFVGTTTLLAHLHRDDNEYAGYDRLGRIVHLGTNLPIG